MDFQQLVNEKIDNLLKSGFVNEAIEAHAKKMLDEIIKNMFSTYGTLSDTIKKTIEEQLNVSLQNLQIPEYSAIVAGVVRSHLMDSVIDTANVNIRKTVESIVGLPEKRKYKLSEIAIEFMNSIGGVRNIRPTIMYEKSTYGFSYIYLDEQKKTRSHDCEFRITIYDNKVSSFSVRGQEIHAMRTAPLGRFAEFMFKLFACAVSIELDTTAALQAVEDFEIEEHF